MAELKALPELDAQKKLQLLHNLTSPGEETETTETDFEKTELPQTAFTSRTRSRTRGAAVAE